MTLLAKARPTRFLTGRPDTPRRRFLSSLVALFGVAVAGTLPAQTDEPLQSPKAVVSQVVGLEPITITYHSPGVKEREIWGELVPFGQNWRAGANDKTTIEFGEDVVIAEKTLAAGTYGFYVLPQSASEWQLVFNSSSVGSPNEFDPEKDVLRVTVQPQEAPFRERLRYSIENFADWPPFTAEIVLRWERLEVVLPLEVRSRFEPP